jgi:hypothetical protein
VSSPTHETGLLSSGAARRRGLGIVFQIKFLQAGMGPASTGVLNERGYKRNLGFLTDVGFANGCTFSFPARNRPS